MAARRAVPPAANLRHKQRVRSAKATPQRRRRTKISTLREAGMAALLAETKSAVDERLHELLAKSRADHASGDPALAVVHDSLADLCLRGGKRLRAALVLVGELAAGGGQREAAIQAGVALELVQAFFLIQDDWMDRDELRRGGPTVHVALSKAFGSDHLGAIGAVLAGDYASVLALKVLSGLPIPSRRLSAVMACFAGMQGDAIMGQQLDTLAKAPDPAEVCRLKTASYSVRGPLVLGATLGGARRRLLDALANYAEPIGLAFQLRDDLLSAFGSPGIGKPRANDLIAGKPTLLSRLAFEAADTKQRAVLRLAYGKPKATVNQVTRALAVFEDTGARALVEREIERNAQQALEVARSSLFAPPVQRLLAESVQLLAHRKS